MKWFFIICGAYLLLFLFSGFWAMLIEKISPFKYTAVPLSDLKSHFSEFFRRGYNKSQMIVQCENKPVLVKLLKVVCYFQPGFKVLMIVECDENMNINSDQLKEVLKEKDLPFDCGLGEFKKNQFGVYVDCSDSEDIAAAAADTIFTKCFGIDSENTFELWVKGMVDWGDILIDSMNPNTGTVWYMTLTGGIPLGKPYKRAHIPNEYTIASLFGKAVGMLLHLFGKR